MYNPHSHKMVEMVLQFQDLKEELAATERNYKIALLQDKEFEVLKELKTQINELKRKIEIFSSAINNNTFKN